MVTHYEGHDQRKTMVQWSCMSILSKMATKSELTSSSKLPLWSEMTTTLVSCIA